MDFVYNINDFNTEKLFSVLRDQYKYEVDTLTEDIYCRNIKDLRREGGTIICCVDIYRMGLPIDDYLKFYNHHEDPGTFLNDNGEEEKERILSYAKEKNWSPDEGLAASINGEEIGLALRVSLDTDRIRLEEGLVRSDPETGLEKFIKMNESGMPEINRMIGELIESCKLL